jgi:hypothetical protein
VCYRSRMGKLWAGARGSSGASSARPMQARSHRAILLAGVLGAAFACGKTSHDEAAEAGGEAGIPSDASAGSLADAHDAHVEQTGDAGAPSTGGTGGTAARGGSGMGGATGASGSADAGRDAGACVQMTNRALWMTRPAAPPIHVRAHKQAATFASSTCRRPSSRSTPRVVASSLEGRIGGQPVAEADPRRHELKVRAVELETHELRRSG